MRRLILTVLLVAMTRVTAQPDVPTAAYTYVNASGNRYLPGLSASFPNVEPADLQLDGTPLWVVGGVVGGVATWVVALDDGRVIAAQPLAGGIGVTGLAIEIGQVEPGAPIAATFSGNGLPVLHTAGDDASPLSHPVVLDEMSLYVATNGDLVLWRDDAELDRAADTLQPDARPVLSASGQIATYTDATADRYVHGIMGDDKEAAALTVYVVEDDSLVQVARAELPGEDVFEGISPFWADLNDDGEQEIITTVSNASQGAWLRAYTADGELLAESRAIGQGLRWRHQIAVGPFGPKGETQLADVRTPHIGGMPEFLTLCGAQLSVNNAQLGYTSHVINSRNLDMALAGDFDGDGVPELVLTDPTRRHLAAVANTEAGVTEMWRLPLDATLTTNLAAVPLAGGEVALAAGTDANVLRVWQAP